MAPQTCKICGLEVSCRSSLYRHLKTHEEQSKWQCELCFKSYSRKDYIPRHYKRHHPDQIPVFHKLDPPTPRNKKKKKKKRATTPDIEAMAAQIDLQIQGSTIVAPENQSQLPEDTPAVATETQPITDLDAGYNIGIAADMDLGDWWLDILPPVLGGDHPTAGKEHIPTLSRIPNTPCAPTLPLSVPPPAIMEVEINDVEVEGDPTSPPTPPTEHTLSIPVTPKCGL
jgi:hypothetical protein